METKLNCILLIDDDEATNFIDERVIQRSKCCERIIVAESGQEGLEYLQSEEEAPDLIFLDLNMPAMTGWEFLHRYRELPGEKRTHPKMIMLSTTLNPADVDRALAMPEICDFLRKPLTSQNFKGLLVKHFGMYL